MRQFISFISLELLSATVEVRTQQLELHTESVFLVGIGRYFSVFTIPIPKENSVSIFGLKTLAGASQKIGGSPLFPKKGGARPPLKKKGIPAKKIKKRDPAKS
jgi:hypothetical protein